VAAVPPLFLAFLVGLGQGLFHAVGPDHCAAMATLGTLGPARRRATFLVALRFALGHAAVLGGVASVCLVAGVGLSETFERWAEVFGGMVLVALAITAFLFPNVLRHGHPHLPGHTQEPHSHLHDSHTHERVTTAAGALMAVSGVRSLLLALPPLLVGGSLQTSGWTYLPGFALGILLGMGAVGLLLAEGLARLDSTLAERLQRIVAVGSAALGLFWIVNRL
jgi:nickel/cobalt transporter (NicO) family protein